jgi:NADPH:quinone reductase-like Zn-dependent oxidoreductase
MKAIVCTKYGSPDVLELQEVEKPTPESNEVSIKVYAASATAADCMMRAGTPFYGRLFIGLMRPNRPITGTGFAGVVEAVGKEVKLFKEGNSVFGETGVGFSTNAEYVCVPEDGVLTTLPNNLTYEEAATICDGALTSWSFLKDIGKIQSGQKVLVNGAAGSLGSSAVQIANYFGAEVTGVCSTTNLEMVKSLGAEKVIDYTKEDFTKTDRVYDIIFDTVGKSSFPRCKDSLKENGVYLSPVLSLPLLFQMIWTSKIGSQKAKFSATGLRPVSDLRVFLNELKESIESGKIKLVIDRSYPLAQTADAHRYIETGHKKGNVVITVAHNHKT